MESKTRILLNPENNRELIKLYERAFQNGTEVFLATAFLTDWGFKVPLNRKCQKFLAIVGTNFGLTRKRACQKLYDWLPRGVAFQAKAFRVVPGKTFHPKILVWKENDSYFALVGSSNLTSAAMSSNYEINTFNEIDERQYKSIQTWFNDRSYESEKIEPTWIEKYKEADLKNCRSIDVQEEKEAVFDLKLNPPSNITETLAQRKNQCENFLVHKDTILKLLNDCASVAKKETVSKMEIEEANDLFWKSFSKLWHFQKDGKLQFRFQGNGVERTCTKSNWNESTTALLEIINSEENLSIERLDVLVAQKIDDLCKQKNPARGAWLSEMLCQFFPDFYPVKNDPVEKWIESLDWKFETGLSEGQWYIELSRRLRNVVYQNKDIVNNLAELDHVIWAIQESQGQDKK